MIIPITCFNCGYAISQHWEDYIKKIQEEKKDEFTALAELRIIRYCCRRMLLTHVESINIAIAKRQLSETPMISKMLLTFL